MKKILITGAGSYIGTSFENYMGQWKDEYRVDTVDMIDGSWREKDFAGYDVVYHVAGIAHSDNGKISIERERLYRTVNTDLTIEVARKAKKEGVNQFVFMSSMIVFSGCSEKYITKEIEPKAINCYGDSKIQAENGINLLNDEKFKVCSLRPPMIYGKGSKGNYPELAKLAKKLPVFPVFNNKRSMLYIENLCQFVKLVIDNEENGVFYPQNREYVKTSDMVKMIADVKGHNIIMLPGLGWLVKLMMKFPGQIGELARKAFGDLAYDVSLSRYKEEYCIVDLQESIRRTEG